MIASIRGKARAVANAFLARMPGTRRLSLGPSEWPADGVFEEGLSAEPFIAALPAGGRTIYVYVDHTIGCSTNTGVQRVVRGLAAGMIRNGERVRFVKWDPKKKGCVLVNREERRYLGEWNGPVTTAMDEGVYPRKPSASKDLPKHSPGENSWLIVPEVVHLASREEAITLDVLCWARRNGLKSGCVFYDAIPLRREDCADLAPRHRDFMRQLRLADVVWPISKWSEADLLSFWAASELANTRTAPETTTISLAGEIDLTARATVPDSAGNLIVSVGTIDQRKNQMALINAFRRWLAKHPGSPWRLSLAGNLHPAVAKDVEAATAACPAISYLGHVDDDALRGILKSAAFTVFPSVEEGFGLPILESLWHAKPCVCADFGAMAEVAEGGGCLAIDTRDEGAIEAAISRLIDDIGFRRELAAQASARAIPTWTDYAKALSARIDREASGPDDIGVVYYWVDATISFPKNTGIQRVNRQLARTLMESGIALVPVKWNVAGGRFAPLDAPELEHLAKWNGPASSQWSAWTEPSASRPGWFLMTELPVNLPLETQQQLVERAHAASLRCAAVFYDAVSWKMREHFPDFYNPVVAGAHSHYMSALGLYDLVLPISDASRIDLLDFLGRLPRRAAGLDERVVRVELPGQFPERPKASTPKARSAGARVEILCVSTIEPRKNHLTLLDAFARARENCSTPMRLTLVGRRVYPPLSKAVEESVARCGGDARWLDDVDDAALSELYEQSDFTVYPSIEEGFGLPILESLWCGKPCVCADFGAMREVSTGGGCLTVDVREPAALAEAIVRLATNAGERAALERQAIDRKFKDWSDYAAEVAARLAGCGRTAPVASSLLSSAEIDQRAREMSIGARPVLSVCVSTYNRAEWLAAALRNWAELYPKPLDGVEFFVCDNCSTDNTKEVAGAYLGRPDFSYRRNPENVGMLGNLRETANRAAGQYIWILGDDDLIMPGAIERVVGAINGNPGAALVYLNYAYTRLEDARAIKDFKAFFRDATPIVLAEPDISGPIRSFAARNENFFTAIYALAFRRDHALGAYSRDTSGRPFSSMLTAIPTTYHVLREMLDEPGVWIGDPQLVVNMNVSWMKYAPLWILERIPEVLELAELGGVDRAQVDRWRRHHIPGIRAFFEQIYASDPLGNARFFSPSRLARRFRHLPEFSKIEPELRAVYEAAHAKRLVGASRPTDLVFPRRLQ